MKKKATSKSKRPREEKSTQHTLTTHAYTPEQKVDSAENQEEIIGRGHEDDDPLK